ncbi:hypothetical protein PSEUBRA_005494 [Kalmanozyma brasiliensis GHG001]|uniref:uncharacterized protein n=1 Tax=Kalmanozyma brasiliensis (strain GHG001) TaxID=1365824 RepID=UPI002867D723|nr:uncharacterized protein PSEUBRA_005494 [Kalmanozyma brasiliensis GHG001]EST05228.2 hypothetical protein PSEUBRA_005494 [Kalmanozyma brasiliensis GHG001]
MFSPDSTTSHTTDCSIPSSSTTTCSSQQPASSGSFLYQPSPAGETPTSLSRARRHNRVATDDSRSPLPADTTDTLGTAGFDSLHELLERAGYKETRIVTPDRHTLADMFARKHDSPPKETPPKKRMVDDFSSDSPSLAADELRRAMQKSAAGRWTPKSATSKSLPSRNYKLPAKDESSVPPLPDAPTPSSSWFSNIWFFGPGTVPSDPTHSAGASVPSEASEQQPAEQQVASSSSTPASVSASASTSRSTSASTSASASASTSSTRPAPPPAKRTTSNNAVWTASVAYRSAKSRTAPVRKGAAISSNVLESDAAAEEAWKALQNGPSNGGSKRRPGLVDAFSSPTKKATTSKAVSSKDSPSRQRKWRQERAAWRESLGDLQAMMDQSRMRREAAAAAVAAAAETATVEEGVGAVAAEITGDNASSPTTSHDAEASPATTKTDDDLAIAKLLSGPALPFLSTDPAVAPRNGSATQPTHLSMRRMKSVEVLSKIIRERRTVAPSTSSVLIDTDSGTISPTHSRRSTPPRLTVSSPRGISSPKELALEGVEFEPTSWSPGRGGVMISNRKVAKKPRSKLRHVSSGSDLRSVAAADALKMPRRGRPKSRAPEGERGPVAALIRDSVGTLSRSSKPRALRNDMYVYDENKDESGQVDDSPTRSKSRRPQRAVLALSGAQNRAQTEEEEDVFRPTLKKKDFAARITRTSKIMRLIEEAENVPVATEEGGELSGSLSRRSRERMHTITRVLGQKQP